MTDDATSAFETLFGRPATVRAEASGRVNLIGEHTDYNLGFVMPIATPQNTRVELAPRDDEAVVAWSRNISEDKRWIEYRLGSEVRTTNWGDYIAGVTVALRDFGHRCGGFDARIETDLPLGGGLSSSASLEVALLRALREAFGLSIDAVAIARIAHRAETELVGAPVGIMDQMAASLADEHAALFLDTRALTFERVALPLSATLIVIHSGLTHRHAAGGYGVRRAECERAAQLLGVRALRDLTLADLEHITLPAPLDRRVRHVVTENARVLDGREALVAGDAAAFGRIMNDSHASMRDDFEVSTPEIDVLVDRAQHAEGVFGARLTGGGFGGSIVALADATRARAAAAHIAADYERRVQRRPAILIPETLPNGTEVGSSCRGWRP